MSKASLWPDATSMQDSIQRLEGLVGDELTGFSHPLLHIGYKQTSALKKHSYFLAKHCGAKDLW